MIPSTRLMQSVDRLGSYVRSANALLPIEKTLSHLRKLVILDHVDGREPFSPPKGSEKRSKALRNAISKGSLPSMLELSSSTRPDILMEKFFCIRLINWKGEVTKRNMTYGTVWRKLYGHHHLRCRDMRLKTNCTHPRQSTTPLPRHN